MFANEAAIAEAAAFVEGERAANGCVTNGRHALGARPDRALVADAPGRVASAVDYGRRPMR